MAELSFNSVVEKPVSRSGFLDEGAVRYRSNRVPKLFMELIIRESFLSTLF